MFHPQQLIENKPLKDLSTFGIGGAARYYIEVRSIEMMQKVICFASGEGLDYIVVGKGSNCLFDDRGFDGLVIVNKIHFLTIKGSTVDVGAGYSFSLLGVQTAKKGLCGLEFACGIPATVGGAIFMNAGASGAETKDGLAEVSFITSSGELISISKNLMEFSYRYCSLQKEKSAIVSARFILEEDAGARQKQLDIIDYRTKTQPYGQKSCGCVFVNPSEGSAGELIEKCGLKGLQFGDAQVSSLHANFIVNNASASAKDVLALAKIVQDAVKEKTGIDLEMEIRCIPFTTRN